MKKMKKIFAVLLSLAMVMGMGMSAFAAEQSATITVEDAEKATLRYVQVIKPDQTMKTGWTFTDVAIAKAYTDAFEEAATEAGQQKVIQEMIDGNGNGLTEEISKALSNVSGIASFATMSNPQTVTSAGVYAIRATEVGFTYNNMAAYVGFGAASAENYPTLANAELTAKKSPTIVTKDNNDPDDVVAIGDEVTYTVTANVPYINPNDTDKTFFIYDTISGATYSLEGATVTMAKQPVTATFVLNADKNGFSIDLRDLITSNNENAGKEIVVTYKAIVVGDEVTNNASAGHEGGSQFGSDTTTTYTGQITLTKYNADESKMLAGAGFEVTKNKVATALTFTMLEDGVYTYDKNGTVTEVVTGADGTLIVKGLDVGAYHFEEKTAPEGYSINELGADATLEVEGGAATAVIKATTSLNNTELGALPATGGIGTTIFTIGGCIIMIGAAALFFKSRKKSDK